MTIIKNADRTNDVQIVRHVLWFNNCEQRAHGCAVNTDEFVIDKHTHHLFPRLVSSDLDPLDDTWGIFLSCYFEGTGTFVVRYAPKDYSK